MKIDITFHLENIPEPLTEEHVKNVILALMQSKGLSVSIRKEPEYDKIEGNKS